ncbi:NlpC/P60 family protein [Streptomyces sp. NPDC059578]|uniref:C40 family peptidase n=1 Tax=Streptomyces sp. NPDC059578 TaxID=3346874 RepID=UPI0036929B8E
MSDVSTRRPHRAYRAARAAVAALVVAALSAPVTADATPAPPDRPVSALLTDLQRLYREAGEATDRFNATEEELARRRHQVGTVQARLAQARGELHASRGTAGRLARGQYRASGSLSPYLRLLTARDPDRLLAEKRVLGRAARHWVAAVDELTADERTAAVLAGRARAALDEQQTLADRRKDARDEVEGRLDEVEELLASLTAAQLAALERLEAATTAEAQRGFLASGALGGSPAARTPTAGGAAAVRFAVAQLGKPYEWGAEGPASFDCSGLTSRAWEEAGAAVPRTSQEQWSELRRVPLDELRPGDLVVYFPGATHVALYLGDGQVVHAPRPGARVKVSPVAANPVLGAVRPDPAAEPLASYAPPELPEGARDGSDTGYGASAAPGS